MNMVYPRISDADRAEVQARAEVGAPPKTKLERYREEHPGEFAGWYVPKTGGYVVAIDNLKVYRGPCKHCETGVVTTVRKLSIRQQAGYASALGGGRWPETCSDCQVRKAEKHADDARRRMRRARTGSPPDRRRRENKELPPHL
ncbi:hypothetical protein JCM12141A_31580 [Mycolicibacterium hodleri]